MRSSLSDPASPSTLNFQGVTVSLILAERVTPTGPGFVAGCSSGRSSPLPWKSCVDQRTRGPVRGCSTTARTQPPRMSRVETVFDTFAVPEWRMSSVVDRAPDECGRGAPAHSVAVMGTVLVAIAHEAVQRALEREAACEVPTAKDHAPVLLQDGALQAFDEAVGPGMARLGARVPNPELATRLIEGAFEFGPTIGQQAADLPAGPLIVRHHDGAQKRGRVGGEMSGQQPGQAVRRGRIAGRNLPDLADALEVADVEGVQAHKLARLFRLDVPGAAVAGAPQALASTFRQQPGRTRRLMLEHGQPSASGGQPDPAQQPLHRAGRQAHPPGPADIYRDVKN